MQQGWIKLHRQMREWEWYDDPIIKAVFLELLLTANHKEKNWHGIIILPGQKVTSYNTISSKSGVKYNQARRAINVLKRTGEITVKTTNKYSIITIVKWEEYQIINSETTDNPTSKHTVKPQSNHSQTTTNKNVKNDKNVKKKNTSETSSQDTIEQDIKELFNIFYSTINKGINFGQRTFRSDAKWLLENNTKEEVILAAQYAVDHHGEQYFPSIINPTELRNKYPKLLEHFNRK